jgi:hypothetical protein
VKDSFGNLILRTISRRSAMKNEGIVLGGKHASAIVRLGYKEGYVEHLLNDSPFKSGYSASIMTSALNPVLQENVLIALLIFGKAYIPIIDNFNLEKLEKEDLIKTYQYPQTAEFDKEEAMALKQLIIEDVRRHKLSISGAEYDKLIESAEDSIKGLLDDVMLTLIKPNSKEAKKAEEERNKIRAIRQAHYDISSLLRRSKELNGIPAFTTVKPAKKSKKAARQIPTPKDSIQVCRFSLPEMKIPKLVRLEQVLRLREDKRITNFREKIIEWTGYLRKGEKDSEEKIRQEITKAKKDLEKIKTTQIVSTISTVLSIPAFAVDLFFTGGAIGAPLLGGSVGHLIYEYKKKKKYEWLLFGT